MIRLALVEKSTEIELVAVTGLKGHVLAVLSLIVSNLEPTEKIVIEVVDE